MTTTDPDEQTPDVPDEDEPTTPEPEPEQAPDESGRTDLYPDDANAY